ncbi:hypothetical protein P4O66_012608, partial [Electrophorus voltai]
VQVKRQLDPVAENAQSFIQRSLEQLTMSENKDSSGGDLCSVDFEIFGYVQGVCFRMYAERKGLDLGLVGWVKNTSKGTVVGQVQGPRNLVNEMRRTGGVRPKSWRGSSSPRAPRAAGLRRTYGTRADVRPHVSEGPKDTFTVPAGLAATSRCGESVGLTQERQVLCLSPWLVKVSQVGGSWPALCRVGPWQCRAVSACVDGGLKFAIPEGEASGTTPLKGVVFEECLIMWSVPEHPERGRDTVFLLLEKSPQLADPCPPGSRKVWLSKEGSPFCRISRADFKNERKIPKLELFGFSTRF